MSAEAFRRARSFLKSRQGWATLAHGAGAAAGALYVGWMILLALFVQLLFSGADYQPNAPDLPTARRLHGDQPGSIRVSFPDSGMLSAVVETEHRWYGGLLERIYSRAEWTHHNVSYLSGLLLAALGIGVLRMVLLYVQSLAVAEATSDASSQIQRELFKRKFELGHQAFDPEIGAAIAPLLREEVPAIHKGLAAWLDVSFREWLKLILLLILVLLLNPFLGLTFVLLAALLWMVGSAILVRILARRQLLAADAKGQLHRVLGLADTLRLIKGYAADGFFRDRIEEHLARYHQDTLRRMRYEARLVPYWQFSGLLLMLVVLGLAAQNVLSGKFALSGAVGVGASLVSLALPVVQLLRSRQVLRRAELGAERVFGVLDQPIEHRQSEGSSFLHPLNTAIEMERVSYIDIRGKALIDNLSIRIHAGQRIALVGRSEIEQRAFVYLLTRFLDPTRGRIRFDGIDLRDVTLESLRSQVCLVLQSDLLFPDTVANNIGLGDPGFSMQRIIEAAKMAHAHHFIQRLPHGYECLIGEEGFPLKPGEIQRIALARAILRDPAVVVVEEPKTSLDDDTKAALDDTMNRFFPGRTVLLLPHRLATIRACDQIFLLDKGKLVSCGSHRELLETSELYRHLQYTAFHNPSFAS